MCSTTRSKGKANIAIISGGTATNSLITVFDELKGIGQISFILPVSDNGGSSAEILRVFGGPAIGDLRSRITKLTSLKDKKTQKENKQNVLFGLFFNYRLSIEKDKAAEEWKDLIEGQHQICSLLPNRKVKNYILFLLIFLNKTIYEKKVYFNFQNASIGNLFILSLRLFYDFDIYQCADFFVRFVGINERFTVCPSINSKNKRYNIAVQLENGHIIKGQSQISHPSPTEKKQILKLNVPSDIDLSTIDLNQPQLLFQKDHSERLVSPIKKTYYVNDQNQEYQPYLFEQAQKILSNSNIVIYSIGSLITSILPVLILKDTAKSILSGTKKKIFLLNGNLDRETGDWNALDFISIIINSFLYSLQLDNQFNATFVEDYDENLYKSAHAILKNHNILNISPSLFQSFLKLLALKNDFFNQLPNTHFQFFHFISHLFFLGDCNIEISTDIIEKILKIKCIKIKTIKEGSEKSKIIHYKYNLKDFETKLDEVISK